MAREREVRKATADGAGVEPRPLLERPGVLLALLGAYFALQVLIRVTVPGTVERDEGEQLVLTQALRLGYGPELSLYVWLQYGFFALFGRTVFALSLLKNLLLFLTYLFTYLAARECDPDRRTAVVAALSLLLVPQIAWESQRDLTNTVLVTALAAGTVLFLLRAVRTARTADFLLLGVLAGLGMLAKYNFVILAVASGAAAALVPGIRGRLAGRRLLATGAAFLAIVAVPYGWIATHQESAFAKAGKLQAAGVEGAAAVARGAGMLALSVLLFLCVLLPVHALVFGLDRRSPARGKETTRLFGWTVLLSVAACLALVLALGVSTFKDRWLQPLLYPIPLLLATFAAPRMTPRRYRAFTALGLALAGVVLAAFAGRTLLGGRVLRPHGLNADFAGCAAELRAAGFTKGVIVTENYHLGGNLKLHFPDSVVNCTAGPPFAEAGEGQLLVVWGGKAPEPPLPLLRYVERIGGVVPADARPGYVKRTGVRAGYLVVPPRSR
jgi:hypothetical protein